MKNFILEVTSSVRFAITYKVIREILSKVGTGKDKCTNNETYNEGKSLPVSAINSLNFSLFSSNESVIHTK